MSYACRPFGLTSCARRSVNIVGMTTRPLAPILLSLVALGVAASPGDDLTLQQTYQAAKAGEIARAQRKVDAVLQSNPNSAKAHYVKAELSARQHDYVVAREELAIAEKLAPGLPFAKKDSLEALRRQIALAPAPAEAPAAPRR